MPAVRVGVIGLGEVAQTVHLPILSERPDRFEITAVCDVSPGAVATMADRYRVAGRHHDHRDLVERDDVDAVLVLASDEYHADFVIAACRAGKHVFVEKPLCLVPDDVARIVEERDRAGVRVMVGYMRRFAPAFLRAVEELADWTDITYVKVRDLIGENRLLIDQAHVVRRFDDVDPQLVADRARRARTQLDRAIGSVPEPVANAYRLMCGLSSHGVSALREAIGPPASVASARTWRNGRFVVAVLDYDDHVALMETGVDQQVRFDASLEVHSPLRSLVVRSDSPYLRNLPTVVTRSETVGDAHHRVEERPTFTDPYVHELDAFHDVVTRGTAPKTSAEDSAEDLRIFQSIARRLVARPGRDG